MIFCRSQFHGSWAICPFSYPILHLEHNHKSVLSLMMSLTSSCSQLNFVCQVPLEQFCLCSSKVNFSLQSFLNRS